MTTAATDQTDTEGLDPKASGAQPGGLGRAAIVPSKKHWWDHAGLIALVTALIAAVAPVTSGINGYFELQAQQDKNRFDTRERYLDRALKPELGIEERELLFEFLVVVFKGDPLEKWAEQQLEKANVLVAEAKTGEVIDGANENLKQIQQLTDQQILNLAVLVQNLHPFESRSFSEKQDPAGDRFHDPAVARSFIQSATPGINRTADDVKSLRKAIEIVTRP